METLTIDIITAIANLAFILLMFFIGYFIGVAYSALREMNKRIKDVQLEIEDKLRKMKL
jgi:cbb3-type cytochrome oxidase subunit 3